MLLHVWLLMKSLSTILTRIRSGITVYKEVCWQSAAPLETFPTLLAFKTLLSTVKQPETNVKINRINYEFLSKFTCADWDLSHDQMSYHKCHKQRVWFHYDSFSHEPLNHEKCRISSHTLDKSIAERLLPGIKRLFTITQPCDNFTCLLSEIGWRKCPGGKNDGLDMSKEGGRGRSPKGGRP